MSPAAISTRILAFLTAHIDPAFAQGQRRFFREQADSFGVRTVHLNTLVRDVSREIKPWPAAKRDELMELLWQTGKLEPGVVACHVYRRFARSCAERESVLFESWIDRYVHNWAHADGVASWLLAACIANQPELRHRLTPWTASPNRWKRRSAAAALLQEAKHGRHTGFLFAIAASLLPDRDDMVEKGLGWLLKEAYPASPEPVVAFLTTHGPQASRQTLRYAAGKMSAQHRAAVLG
jgi:3-methyladenine DNA glycosylase AlkD